MGPHWSDTEIEILKKLATAKKTAKEISLVLKSRTVQGIKCKAEELNINVSGTPEPEIDFEAFQRIIQNTEKSKWV